MISKFTFLIACLLALLLPHALAGTTSIRYLTQPPDGEMPYWTWPNHDDSAWNNARDLEDLNRQLRESPPREVYIRITSDLRPESINHSWFHIRHSGPIEMHVNGIPRGGPHPPAPDGRDYHTSPRRAEALGRNTHAIHFHQDAPGTPLLAIEWKSNPWSECEETSPRPPPVIPDAIRDAQVCRGGDGAWYLTGTTGDDTFFRPGPECWLRNPGIRVYRSEDLTSWKSLGDVWTFERDGTWNKDFGTFAGRGPARAVFAPEIHFLKGYYWLVYSVNSTTPSRSFGIGLARADRPTGPWTELSPQAPITDGFDPSLFEDQDGRVYLLKHGGAIAPLKNDLSGIDGPFREIAAENFPRVGYEGVSLTRHGGRYYLTAAEWNVHADGRQSYDCMISGVDSILGPYGPRRCLIRYGGHNSLFPGPDGTTRATVWCYTDADPHWQRVSIIDPGPLDPPP